MFRSFCKIVVFLTVVNNVKFSRITANRQIFKKCVRITNQSYLINLPFVSYAVLAASPICAAPMEMKLIENVSIRQSSILDVRQFTFISVVFVNLKSHLRTFTKSDYLGQQ